MNRKKAVPQELINGIVNMVVPYMEDTSIRVYLEETLNALNHKSISLSDMARMEGITKPAMLVRLQKKGIHPVKKGGRTGRDSLYDFFEAKQVLFKKD